tara:strand:- start:209628 stop:210173 length:546 start_codon:yes stop_codon:yes gene_type:complete
MSALKIFSDSAPSTPLLDTQQRDVIEQQLHDVGIRFEQWNTQEEIQPGAAAEDVMRAYRQDIDRLISEQGYQTVDVVSLSSDHPDKATLRKKFLDEHRHSEDEVRFFVAGSGLFTLHLGNKVYEVLCQQGDLISVPANTPHWFDMGPNPYFVAIRLFNNPDGWVANFTGDDIASRFSRLEN